MRNARRFRVDPSTAVQRALENEPARLTVEDFRALLMSCVLSGASDVTVQTDRHIRAEISGTLHLVTRRAIGSGEANEILAESYGNANAGTEIAAKKVLDYSYQLNLADGSRQRFRCNATGIHARAGEGVEVTFRSLPAATPDVDMMDLAPGVLRAMIPRDGLVVVAGSTGQGKSTLLAAVMRHLLETAERPMKLIDIQSPIEFTYEDVWKAGASASTVGQSEVDRHIESFAEGVRSALRRKPHVISVGEARDYDTIAATLEAAITGHLVYTTTHAGSVPDVVRRLLSVFPAIEREARAYDLAAALRVILVQELVPASSGSGRVPVREFLVVSRELRERLLSRPHGEWAGVMVEEMAKEMHPERRETMACHAERLYEKGAISDDRRQRLSRGLA